MSEKNYALHYLSEAFYEKYSSEQYPEIEKKASRQKLNIQQKTEDKA